MINSSTKSLSQVIDPYPLTLNAATSVPEAIAQMNKTQATCVLVEEEGRLVGLFSERDVVRVAATGRIRADVAIASVMNRQVITLNESETQNPIVVLSTLQKYQICHLPIVKDLGQAERGRGGENFAQFHKELINPSPAHPLTLSPPHLRQVVGLVSLTDPLSAIALFQDICDRKQADSELQQAYTEGCPESSCAVMTDIMALKAVESQLQQAKDQLQAVLNAVPGYVSWMSADGRYLGTNRYLAEAFNLTPEDFIGRELGFFTDNCEFALSMRQFLASSAQTASHVINININGSTRNYLIAAQKYHQGTKAVVVGIDITERQRLGEKLQAQNDFLQTVLDTNPNKIFVKDTSGKYILVNQACADFHEMTVEDLLGKTDTQLKIDSAYAEQFIAHDEEVLTTLQQQVFSEVAYQTPSGEVRWFQTIKKPIFSSEGKVHQILGVATDITEHKLAAEKLRQSEAQIHLALDAARMGFWDCDLINGKSSWSNHLERLYGFAPNTYDGTYQTFLSRMHPEDRDRFEQANQRCLETGEECDIEFRIILPDGTMRWIESKGQVFYDETGKPVRMTGINLDISDRKQAETQIKQSLREKEVLLQEVHHRVKNNLQVISSLLDLQSQHIQEPAFLEMFRESRNRVKSMVLVHEKLYQSKDCAKINFSDYVKTLTTELFQAYAVEANHIILELNIDEVALDIEAAIPCGLIINELVSNALKYAFPTSKEGILEVAIRSDINQRFTLIVRDSGVGFPNNFDLPRVRSLGLQLVSVLIEQLEGKIELDRSAGTKFTITFPI